jgi:hypothetical protein
VQFDRGDGGEPAAKELLNGTYRITASPNTQLLDVVAQTTDGVVIQAAATSAPRRMDD